jgi:hypothetical protein
MTNIEFNFRCSLMLPEGAIYVHLVTCYFLKLSQLGIV